jgi:hypothetical protein
MGEKKETVVALIDHGDESHEGLVWSVPKHEGYDW